MNTHTAHSPPRSIDDEQQPVQVTRLSSARSRELGEELRRVRHQARRSSEHTAAALGWSLGKLSKLENGRRGTSPWEIATLLGHLGADNSSRDRIHAIANEPDTGSFLRVHHEFPDTLTALTVHERLARTITTYEPFTIPSIAQTETYAYALTGDRELTRARVDRQDPLRLRGRGPATTLYVHEAALRMMVCDPAVMRDQLLHLTLMCGWTGFTPLVIPMTTPSHSAIRNPATLLTFDPPHTPLAYTETDTATVFHVNPHDVALYQTKMRNLASLALSPTQSHDVFARWADHYDYATS
ncbi:helix-turn-helix domain-containing protein [Saccharothrix saharensis]|uniref:helix-turn-helix domain-containing protein n=1 Tax=Saccharothrix saharensis TaxID=571190 RepID=UPI0036A5DB8A